MRTGLALMRSRTPDALTHLADKQKDCLKCGQPWPCEPGKVELAAEFEQDRDSLRIYLATHLLDAIDLRLSGNLYERFINWSRRPHAAQPPEHHPELVPEPAGRGQDQRSDRRGRGLEGSGD